MKLARTWILVADGGRAHVLERLGAAHQLAAVDDMVFEAELPRTSELGSDRPGRSFQSNGAKRHAHTARRDLHDALEDAFVQRLVATLAAAQTAARFDQLVLIAPPRALGVLRQQLTNALRAVVRGEIDKDLTKSPRADVEACLADHVWP